MKTRGWGLAISITMLLVLSASAVGCQSAPGATAEKFPTKSLNAIVNTEAGAPMDLLSRALAGSLGKQWGVSIQVENKPGGNGVLGPTQVLSQPADGYLYTDFTASQAVAMAQGTFGSINSPDQLLMIGRVESDPFVVAVRNDAPWKTWADLVAEAKAKPGQVAAGSYGSTSSFSMNAIQVGKLVGVQWKWVAYESNVSAAKALLAGELPVQWGASSALIPYVKSGDVRILAVSADKRLPFWPDVPTFKELGVDNASSQWRGFVMHPKTPSAIANAYYDATRKALKDAPLTDYFAKAQTTPMDDIGTGAQQSLVNEYNQFKKLLEAMKK